MRSNSFWVPHQSTLHTIEHRRYFISSISDLDKIDTVLKDNERIELGCNLVVIDTLLWGNVSMTITVSSKHLFGTLDFLSFCCCYLFFP